MFIGAAKNQFKGVFTWDTYTVTLNDDGMEKYTKYKTFKHTLKGTNAGVMTNNAKKWINKKIAAESKKAGKYIVSELKDYSFD